MAQFNDLFAEHLDVLRFQNKVGALSAMVLSNAHRNDKEHPQPFSLDDFMLIQPEPEVAVSSTGDDWRALKANFKAYTEAVKTRRERGRVHNR